MNKKAILFTALFVIAPTASFAGSDLYGDKDCFGTNGACVEDGVTWLPGGWGAVTATAEDPAYTDVLLNTGDLVSWTHTVSPGPYANTSLEIRTAGIADIEGPYQVLVDDVVVGEMPYDGFGHILVETFVFDFDAGLLSDGSVTVKFDPEPSDSWAIDYSEIIYDEGETVPVPTLSQWSLIVFIVLMASFGYLGVRRRHH